MTEEVAVAKAVAEPTKVMEASKVEEKTKKEEVVPVPQAVLDAVAERLSFFFSDANVRQDMFMRKFLTGSGYVPVDCLLRFNTIKKHTKSADAVVKAAQSLPQLVVTSEGIGRKDPFTSKMMDENIPLTLHLSNIPCSDEKYTVSTDDLRNLFGGKGIALVKLRFQTEQRRKQPTGSALVEFENLDFAQAAAKETIGDSAKELKLGDQVIEVMLLKDYIDSRKGKEPTGKRKSVDNDKGDNAEEKKEEKEDETPVKAFTFDWKPGSVVSLTGLDCDREALLSAVAKALDCTVEQVKERNIYADYSRGQADGAIRFKEPCDDVKLLCDKLLAGDVMVAEKKVETAKILTGDEEKEYWDNFIAFKNKQIKQRSAERSGRKNHKKPRRN